MRRTATAHDRLPPHAPEAEQGLLSCVLSDPERTLAEARSARVDADQFYDLRNRAVWEAVCAMSDASLAVDALTLERWLKDHGGFEQVGGRAYLDALPDFAPSAANWSYYADTLRSKATARKLIRVCTELAGRAYEVNGEVAALVDEAEREVLGVRPQRDDGDRDMRALVKVVVGDMEERVANKGRLRGIATGLADLDRLTGGLRAPRLVVLGGLSSQGKSALAMNVVESAALGQGLPVAVFSLEMSSEELVERMIFSLSRTNSRRLDAADLTEQDLARVLAAAGRLAAVKVHFDDISDLTVDELRARARRAHQRHGVRLVVVDYLQLLGGGSAVRRDASREQEVSTVAKHLKQMAKELRVPVLALSQLNEEGKLRESKAIGQHADDVWKLAKRRKQGVDEEDDGLGDDAVPMVLKVLKQRNGPTGKVDLTFLKCYTRFESAAKASQEDGNAH